MRLPEQKVWDAMKAARPSDVRLERIENIAGEGTPDVLLKYAGTPIAPPRFAFCELKAGRNPVKNATPVLERSKGVRISQIGWHMECASLGLWTWILIRDAAGELYLVAGKHAREINSMSRTALREVRLASDWPTIYEVMRRR